MMLLKLQWLGLLLITLALRVASLRTGLRTVSLRTAHKPLCRMQATAAASCVRRAVASDFEQIAGLRAAVEPVMAAGGAGFMGAKASNIDPEVARRKQLAAKVGELISGESIALIVLQQVEIVGTVDCTITEARGQTPKHLHLKNMLVLPAHRSVIAAHQMLASVISSRMRIHSSVHDSMQAVVLTLSYCTANHLLLSTGDKATHGSCY
jgi:hypothetical protein